MRPPKGVPGPAARSDAAVMSTTRQQPVPSEPVLKLGIEDAPDTFDVTVGQVLQGFLRRRAVEAPVLRDRRDGDVVEQQRARVGFGFLNFLQHDAYSGAADS